MRERIVKTIGVAGTTALVAGLLLRMVRFEGTALSLALLVAGGVLLAALAVLNRRELVRAGRGRSARRGANAILMTAFFLAIVALVQTISVENRRQFDLTRNARFTLAPQTLDVLRSLDTDVHVLAFFRHTAERRADAQGLLERYARETERLRFEVIDPDRDPGLTDEMGARYGDLVVTAGERRRVVRTLTEEALTNAVLQVTLARFKSVCFVTGHGERNPEEKGRTGYEAARRALEGQGYTVRTLSLIDVVRIPEDCEVLVVAGPRRLYLASEIELIRSYLRSGGRALFLMDPRIDLPGVESILGDYNLVLDPIVLLDEYALVDGERVFDATVTKIRRYEAHEITRNFNMITMFPRARTVRIAEDTTTVSRITAQYLALTGESAWGETNMESFEVGQASLDDDDYVSPLPVAAVATRTPALDSSADERESRVVVFGDSDFASNTFLGLLGNADLFLNSVRYLAGDEKLITIRPREGLGDSVFITAAQGRLIFIICLVLLPLSVVASGVNILLRRRKQTS